MVQRAFSAQLTQWLGALPFVVEAMLWTTVARVGGIRYVHAGAALAVRIRP
jgi:hypothetical protein